MNTNILSLPNMLFNGDIPPNNTLLPEIPKRTVIATTTLYKTNPDGTFTDDTAMRAKLALQLVHNARERGYDIVVVDGGSDTGWRHEIKDTGAVLVDENISNYPGKHFMGRSRRQALDIAANLGGHDIISWIEPEKAPYIITPNGESPLAMTASAIADGRADLIIPRRMDNLTSYPLQQQLKEIMANLTYQSMINDALMRRGSVTRVPYLDLQIGPRTISKNDITYFVGYNGTVNGKPFDRWESIFIPVVRMILDGKRAESVAVPYVHPAEQTRIESDNPVYDCKRVEQASVIVTAIGELLKMA